MVFLLLGLLLLAVRLPVQHWARLSGLLQSLHLPGILTTLLVAVVWAALLSPLPFPLKLLLRLLKVRLVLLLKRRLTSRIGLLGGLVTGRALD
jgi:hypothetical protein